MWSRGFDGWSSTRCRSTCSVCPLIHAYSRVRRIVFAQRHPCVAVLGGFMQSFILNEPMAGFLTIERCRRFLRCRDGPVDEKPRGEAGWPRRRSFTRSSSPIRRATLKPLIAFLGLEWRPELLDHRASARAEGRSARRATTRWYGRSTRPPRGRWRRYRAGSRTGPARAGAMGRAARLRGLTSPLSGRASASQSSTRRTSRAGCRRARGFLGRLDLRQSRNGDLDAALSSRRSRPRRRRARRRFPAASPRRSVSATS